MDENTRRYWVGINMNSAITPRRFHILLSCFPNVESIWKASESDIRNINGFEDVAAEFCEARDPDEVDEELRRCQHLGLELVSLEDDNYPESLRAVEKPPPLLYCKGEYKDSDQLGIAMVGTRKYSNYGKRVAEKLSSELVKAGFTVVSGMALGIDTFSHQAAINAGGRTVAVMGTGFGNPYPKNNANLMRRIAENGAALTEFPLDQRPTRWSFPQRNRIISGLSRGVIVVEAPERSGALITARDGLEQGREVFAVPGDIRRSSMKGTHQLIKDGAKLVEDASDVIEEFRDLQLALPLEEDHQERVPELSEEQNKVYSLLDYDPIHFNDIVEQADFPPAKLSHIIFQLEMNNLVERLEGNLWAKVR